MAQCTATAKSTRKQCTRPSILGGTVCRFHGGAAPQVIRKAKERIEATRERLTEEACHISFVDIRDAFDKKGNLLEVWQFPDRLARAIAGIEYEDLIETDKNGKKVKVGRTAKIKMCDKLGGIDKAARLNGLYAAEAPAGGVVTIQLVVTQAGAPQIEGQKPLDIMSLVKQ